MIESDDTEVAAARRPVKSEAAFRTISEVSEDLDVPQHVLRFWESKFPQIKPLKRGGGRRYYRPEDVQLLKRIRDLLYKDGYTIRGVQKLLREQPRGVPAAEAKANGAGKAAELPIEPAPCAPVLAPAPEPEPQFDLRPLVVEPPPAAPVAAPTAGRAEMLALLAELEDLRDLLATVRGTVRTE